MLLKVEFLRKISQHFKAKKEKKNFFLDVRNNIGFMNVDDSAQDPHINEFLFPFENHFSFRDLVRDFNQPQ